jgi:Tfp pilus assembly protein PilX
MQDARGKMWDASGAPSTIGNQKSEICNQDGQALVMVLLALTLGVLLVAGFLYYASTSQRATRAARDQTASRYSADAGVEHAIWRLTNETGFTQTVTANSPVVYNIMINGQTVVITVSRVLTP